MAKENIFQHNFRLNMDNPIHYKIHQQLMNIDSSIYKSKNEFMIKMICFGIFGKTELELVEEGEYKNQKADEAERRFKIQRTNEMLNRMERRVTENVMREVTRMLMSMISWNKPVQNFSYDEEKRDYTEEFIDEDIASAALGYFD